MPDEGRFEPRGLGARHTSSWTLEDRVVRYFFQDKWLAAADPVFQDNFVSLLQSLSRAAMILAGVPDPV